MEPIKLSKRTLTGKAQYYQDKCAELIAENAKLREQLANREKYYEEYIKQLKTDAGL